jgi:hypothetical protein
MTTNYTCTNVAGCSLVLGTLSLVRIPASSALGKPYFQNCSTNVGTLIYHVQVQSSTKLVHALHGHGLPPLLLRPAMPALLHPVVAVSMRGASKRPPQVVLLHDERLVPDAGTVDRDRPPATRLAPSARLPVAVDGQNAAAPKREGVRWEAAQHLTRAAGRQELGARLVRLDHAVPESYERQRGDEAAR